MFFKIARTTWFVLWVLSVGSTQALAQQTPIELNRLRPAIRPTDGFSVSRPDDLGHLKLSGQLVGNYAYQPLVYEFRPSEGDAVKTSIVEHHFIAHAAFALGLFDRVVLQASLPIHAVMSGTEASNVDLQPADGFGIGDVTLGVRARLVGDSDDVFSLGVSANVFLPTRHWADDSASYSGESNVRVHPELLGEVRFSRRFRLTANAGVLLREQTTLEYVELDQELTYGLGLTFAFLEQRNLTAHLEATGSVLSVSDFGDRESSPIEGLVGGKYRIGSGLRLGSAVGAGFNRGVGAPDVRVLFSVGYEAEPSRDRDGDGIEDGQDRCPDVIGDPAYGGCPVPDRDGDRVADPEDECPHTPGIVELEGCPARDTDQDGLQDHHDKCPDQAEDADGVQDEDGCPDPDNDGDGVLDKDDNCPNDAEDVDGFKDEDGCPEVDNDGDGFVDENDKCPNEYGVEKEGGCPIRDADRDGIEDDKDKCPNKAETYNGNKDEDGCPDGKQTVIITESEIKITETVYFGTGRAEIKDKSFKLLNTVATVLQKHPQITGVQIEGHTDDVGSESNNLRLSSERADSVKKYLIKNGIEAARLTSIGYGETQPKIDIGKLRGRKLKNARAANRRVSFKITSINGQEINASETVIINDQKVIEN